MDSVTVDGQQYWLPANNDDVIALVNDAAANGEVICLRGSGHSFPIIGQLESRTDLENKIPDSGKSYKYIMLSKMNAVFPQDGTLVKVEAGCHLGLDPFDPTGISTEANSFCAQLDAWGLALPDLGGITHQTIGGFLSTASSGGSTQFSFEDALISLDIVTCGDGKNAEVTTFSRPVPDNPDDPFYAVGIASLGLFGIIVSATFNCISKFYLAGSETITFADECTLVNLFGEAPGSPNLQQFLQQTQYTRLMWWPQQGVDSKGHAIARMVVWQAKRTDLAGAQQWVANAYYGDQPRQADGLKGYQEVPYIAGSPIPATIGADILFTAIGTWPTWLETLLGSNTEAYKNAKLAIEAAYGPLLFPQILNIFVTVNTSTNGDEKGGPQLFSDTWYSGLPMDNQMSDKLFPVWFTELWIDIDQTQAVMDALKAYYNQPTDPFLSFSCEIYAAGHNDFWLSPAYQTDVIRIDIFWFGNNLGDPYAFYQNFWDLLAPFKFRPHWGKYIPMVINPQSAPVSGTDYLSGNYPKWNDWMALRQKMDPKQLFVNDYWRSILGIASL
jgi:hypothetical protein